MTAIPGKKGSAPVSSVESPKKSTTSKKSGGKKPAKKVKG